MPLIKRKSIRDATITPGGVLQGEVGYGNNFERIVGTYTPLTPPNLRSKVFDLSKLTIKDSDLNFGSCGLVVDYENGTYRLMNSPWGSNSNVWIYEATGIDFSDMKKIIGYRMDDCPVIFLSADIVTESSMVFLNGAERESQRPTKYPHFGFQVDPYWGKMFCIVGSRTGHTLEFFYEPL